MGDTFKTTTSKDDMLNDRDLLYGITSTSLKTKLDNDLSNTLSDAIVDSIRCIASCENEDDIKDEHNNRPIDLNRVEIMAMQRKMATQSRFVNGLVMDHGGRHPDMPKVLTNCHIMTCNVTFEYEQTEVQSGFYYSSAE